MQTFILCTITLLYTKLKPFNDGLKIKLLRLCNGQHIHKISTPLRIFWYPSKEAIYKNHPELLKLLGEGAVLAQLINAAQEAWNEIIFWSVYVYEQFFKQKDGIPT